MDFQFFQLWSEQSRGGCEGRIQAEDGSNATHWEPADVKNEKEEEEKKVLVIFYSKH